MGKARSSNADGKKPASASAARATPAAFMSKLTDQHWRRLEEHFVMPSGPVAEANLSELDVTNELRPIRRENVTHDSSIIAHMKALFDAPDGVAKDVTFRINRQDGEQACQVCVCLAMQYPPSPFAHLSHQLARRTALASQVTESGDVDFHLFWLTRSSPAKGAKRITSELPAEGGWSVEDNERGRYIKSVQQGRTYSTHNGPRSSWIDNAWKVQYPDPMIRKAKREARPGIRARGKSLLLSFLGFTFGENINVDVTAKCFLDGLRRQLYLVRSFGWVVEVTITRDHGILKEGLLIMSKD